MNKIAIDIVLLLPSEMSEQVIGVSGRLAETSGNNNIVLDGQQYLPHISLCMGAVDEDNLPAVVATLEDITTGLAPLQLTIDGIRAHDIPTGERLAVLEVVNQEALRTLQEAIADRLRDHLSYDVETSMFFSPPEVAPVSVNWVKGFDQSKGPVMYYPHITCGFGEYADFAFPMDFVAETVAICHLGSYCTCRRILNSFTLQ